MPRKNEDIRALARYKGVALWRIALELGVSEMTLIRWLRVDLTEEKRAAILEAIDVIYQSFAERGKEA